MARRGEEVMGRFLGAENVERGQAFLEDLDPELHRYVIEFVYGDVYAGDVLDPQTRALCTVATLACLDQQLQLAVYVRSARRQGASEDQIREVLRQVAVYAGFPSAWNALATMKRALADAPEISPRGHTRAHRGSTEPVPSERAHQ
jgi:4-carboxymuconolactone decarboxylase